MWTGVANDLPSTILIELSVILNAQRISNVNGGIFNYVFSSLTSLLSFEEWTRIFLSFLFQNMSLVKKRENILIFSSNEWVCVGGWCVHPVKAWSSKVLWCTSFIFIVCHGSFFFFFYNISTWINKISRFWPDSIFCSREQFFIQ